MSGLSSFPDDGSSFFLHHLVGCVFPSLSLPHAVTPLSATLKGPFVSFYLLTDRHSSPLGVYLFPLLVGPPPLFFPSVVGVVFFVVFDFDGHLLF